MPGAPGRALKFYKRLLRNAAVRGVLCALGAGYIRLVHATSSWRVEGGDVPRAYWDRGEPFIVAYWHGRILMMPYSWRRDKTMSLLISQHPDGQFIARLVGRFGLATIAGSTRRGGTAALRAMLRVLKAGGYVGVTPDGPRGPRMRASAGIIDVARLSGAAIVPAAYATSRRRVLSSWDRFVVALPFSRGVFVWGAPIEVPRDAGAEARERLRLTLEERLNGVTAEADRLVGQAAIEPAPMLDESSVPDESNVARP